MFYVYEIDVLSKVHVRYSVGFVLKKDARKESDRLNEEASEKGRRGVYFDVWRSAPLVIG